jgi:hypothetical protein
MPRTLPLGALAIALACAACAAQSDYTPQIAVVPGAAARSLWIASKRPPPAEPEEEDASATPGPEGPETTAPELEGGAAATAPATAPADAP